METLEIKHKKLTRKNNKNIGKKGCYYSTIHHTHIVGEIVHESDTYFKIKAYVNGSLYDPYIPKHLVVILYG